MEPPHAHDLGATGQNWPFESQYRELLPEIVARSDGKLAPIILDVGQVVTRALGVLPQFLKLEPEIVRHLPTFDLARVKRLDVYAQALSHAHARYLLASQRPVSHLPLLEAAVAARATLLAGAVALEHKGLIDGAGLNELKGPNGYKNAAFDLQILVRLFRARGTSIQGKTAISQQELIAALQMASEILTVLSTRDANAAKLAEASALRASAFTLCLEVYGEARRAALYLRPHKGDADAVVPSLYLGRASRRRRRAQGSSARTHAATAAVRGKRPETEPSSF